MKPTPPAAKPILASDLLQRLHDEAPTDHFTLAWLLSTLHNRSFGAILLICAVVAIAPGISVVAGVLLMIIAAQMIAGRKAPMFPTSIALRALPTTTRLVARKPEMEYIFGSWHETPPFCPAY